MFEHLKFLNEVNRQTIHLKEEETQEDDRNYSVEFIDPKTQQVSKTLMEQDVKEALNTKP